MYKVEFEFHDSYSGPWVDDQYTRLFRSKGDAYKFALEEMIEWLDDMDKYCRARVTRVTTKAGR